MILKIFDFFHRKAEVVEVAQEPAPDPNDIYVQLQLALAIVGSQRLELKVRPFPLGWFRTFSTNLRDFNKSLLEVNDVLKEHSHIEQGLFYVKEIKSVKFDNFLFVEDGYYISDTDIKVMRSLDLIHEYLDLMKDAGKAPYGYMEHNHRQLYSYTQSLTEFLNLIVQHFGE